MISQLRGTVASRGRNFAVIDVNGVGYGVNVPDRCLAGADAAMTIFTYMAVRDDAIELFGFSTPQDREFFRLLLGISGIGPRAALGLLGVLDAASLTRAILKGDRARLTAVPGIGKKTAERLILELQEKVKKFALEGAPGVHDDAADVLEVLENLGCERERAREAVARVQAAADGKVGFDEMLAEALQILGAAAR